MGKYFYCHGGKRDSNETIKEAMVRELEEETGFSYLKDDLEFLVTLKYYQKNYEKRDGRILNRLITTRYYVTKYRGINNEKQALSENEKTNNFKLELISINKLEDLVKNNNNNTNPRTEYFNKEILSVIDFFKKRKNK